jgi:uncharacterized YigZ family protein
MADRYSIPAKTARVEEIVVNSRFIGTAGRVDTVEEAKAFIEAIRDEFPDASHHVYAYKVGYGSSVIEGLSDDGEPSGTAGMPVLSVLRGHDIGDTAVVVVRYFGGTKLGTGGLVRAYSGSAKAVLKALPRALKVDWASVMVVIPYNLYERITRLLSAFEAVIDEQDFAVEVTLLIDVPVDRVEELVRALNDLRQGRGSVEVLD